MKVDTFLDLTKGTFPIIIKPNLGQPVLLNLHNDSEQSKKRYTFTAFIVALSSHSIQRILESFISNVYIQPILKEEGDFDKRRGEKYTIKPISIVEVQEFDFQDQTILNERNCIAYDFFTNLLDIEEIFGKRDALYEIVFEISVPIINAISQLMERTGKNLLLFDIVHEIPNSETRKINFHSIAFFNKNWSDFKFIQATDLHIARRNDYIIDFLRDKARNKLERLENKENKLNKIDQFVLNRDYEFREGFQEEKLNELKFGKFNFNYSLR